MNIVRRPAIAVIGVSILVALGLPALHTPAAAPSGAGTPSRHGHRTAAAPRPHAHQAHAHQTHAPRSNWRGGHANSAQSPVAGPTVTPTQTLDVTPTQTLNVTPTQTLDVTPTALATSPTSTPTDTGATSPASGTVTATATTLLGTVSPEAPTPVPPEATPPPDATTFPGYVPSSGGGGLPDPHPTPLTPAQREAYLRYINLSLTQPLPTPIPTAGAGGAPARPNIPIPPYSGWLYSAHDDHFTAEPSYNQSQNNPGTYRYGHGDPSGQVCYTRQTAAGYGGSSDGQGCAATDSYFYGNLCGPGSSTFILHSVIPNTIDGFANGTWGSGGMGYLFHAAYSELTHDGHWGTYWSAERSFLNAEQGSSPVHTYASDPCDLSSCSGVAGYRQLTEAKFEFDLFQDLSHGYALMAATDSSGLPEWNGFSVDHFIAIDGYNASTGLVQYADTATDTEPNPSTGQPFTVQPGDHYTMPEGTFYRNALQGQSAEKMVLW